ncbi:MAG: chromate transporter, partial [Chloroflexota bacterium]|nr:chromate transporter [Chloroflexota bacterium]
MSEATGADESSSPARESGGPGSAGEVARLALKLGFTAFGGPAAHIAMLREEAVGRRRWLSDQYFLDLVGATNLIPGPNSTEM